MLTMTVMQHERGPIGQLSTEAAESEDVLSRLRHLHHTLQECHWRVQLVDHALCAQGDSGHRGPQNQTRDGHNLKTQAEKDPSPQAQVKENQCFQFEIKKDCNPQIEAENPDSREQIENAGLQEQPKTDQNCQNGVREESEDQFCGDFYQKLSKEKHSISTEEQKVSLQAEDDNFHDIEKNFFDCTHDDSDPSDLATNYVILHNYSEKDHHIHNEIKEENVTQNAVKNSPELDSTNPFEGKCYKYLTRQEAVDIDDDDLTPTGKIDTLSSTLGPPHVSKDPNVDGLSPKPDTMTDISEQCCSLITPNVKVSKKVLKQESSHHIEEVQYGAAGVQDLGSKICHKADKDFFMNQEKVHQVKSEEIRVVKCARKVSHADPSPEIAQRMNIIWEALENLRSHFLALHSSLVDSSSLFCSQEFAESVDNSYITLKKNDKVVECDELKTMCEDHTKGLHQTVSEISQSHQPLCEQTFQRRLPFGKHSHCTCHNLPGHQMCSHTTPLEESAKSAAMTDNSQHTSTRTFLRGWRESCLCAVMVVLLLLLILFLASCLLLVLPVVSVSVRTAGGLPAF